MALCRSRLHDDRGHCQDGFHKRHPPQRRSLEVRTCSHTISLFILFNCFALVQYLQYKPVGKWANYLRGEKAYIVLSLVAKSALAWQVFAGTLAG